MSPQTASSHKIRIGNVEVLSVVDTPFQFPLSVPFPQRTDEDFAPYRDLYPACFDGANMLTQATSYVIRSEGKAILCDTGLGPGPIEMLGGIRGRLLEALSENGAAPESIDLVFHTHLHADHVGWNLNRDNVPNFPNARYLAPEADWEAFSGAADQNPQVRQVAPLKEIGRLDLYSGEKALTSEVTVIPTPGHTPGHSSLVISSLGERGTIMGDMAHNPAQVEMIDWCSAFDMDHKTVVENRRKLFDQVEQSGEKVAFGHFPTAFGTLVRSGGRRIFQAL